MGTNYYWSPVMTVTADVVPVGYAFVPPSWHIGKSSAGWYFHLHIHPESGINDLEDWVSLWARGGVIRDEYGKEVPPSEMFETITKRGPGRPESDSVPFGYRTWGEFHLANHSQRGTNGLLRVRATNDAYAHGFISHATGGTYSLFIGEFS